VLAAFWR